MKENTSGRFFPFSSKKNMIYDPILQKMAKKYFSLIRFPGLEFSFSSGQCQLPPQTIDCPIYSVCKIKIFLIKV